MGMFDELQIDKIHLPDSLKNHETGWQTKDLDCGLDLIYITEDGSLTIKSSGYLYGGDISENAKTDFKKLNYSGEIIFYNAIKLYNSTEMIWHEFKASFENGQLTKLIQIEPNNYLA